MPTNLPAEAKRKWAEFQLREIQGRSFSLCRSFQALFRNIREPQNFVRRLRSRWLFCEEKSRRESEEKADRGGLKFFIEKEGAAQIVVLQLTNVGKSSLLAAATNAKVEVSPVPYTTKAPVPGMLSYQDTQFQIVEAPALMRGLQREKLGASNFGFGQERRRLNTHGGFGAEPLWTVVHHHGRVEKTRYWLTSLRRVWKWSASLWVQVCV